LLHPPLRRASLRARSSGVMAAANAARRALRRLAPRAAHAARAAPAQPLAGRRFGALACAAQRATHRCGPHAGSCVVRVLRQHAASPLRWPDCPVAGPLTQHSRPDADWCAAPSRSSLLPRLATQPERGYAAAASRACPAAPPARAAGVLAPSPNPELFSLCSFVLLLLRRSAVPPHTQIPMPSLSPTMSQVRAAAARGAAMRAPDAPAARMRASPQPTPPPFALNAAVPLPLPQGNISKWRKREGDKVAAGDVLAEIETVRRTRHACAQRSTPLFSEETSAAR
jgi:hypothetical protein